jgi:hypothetical protein
VEKDVSFPTSILGLRSTSHSLGSHVGFLRSPRLAFFRTRPDSLISSIDRHIQPDVLVYVSQIESGLNDQFLALETCSIVIDTGGSDMDQGKVRSRLGER